MSDTTQQVFDFLCQYIKQYSRAPTIREIGDSCFLHPSTVKYHLTKLELRGWIESEPNRARSISILRSPNS